MTTEPNTPETDADFHSRARIIAEALPYMLRYDDQTVVVKYGGHAMGSHALSKAFAEDITLLKLSGLNPVVVHGGGPQIGAMLDRLGIKSEFRDGLRVTDRATVEIVEMVLAGSINKEIVSAINAAGGRAVGLSGKDGRMVTATKVTRTTIDPNSNIEAVVDLGFVGEPTTVRREVLDIMARSEIIPVLAPVAPDEKGDTYNINADTFAGAVAGALNARRLLFLTDVPGVLDRDKNLIKELSVADARRLIADGTISGGMIPKVETCIEALERGVEGVVILDGKVPHVVLLELFTERGAGTLITP
ncbi:N-acetylglutamate kinase [Pseudoxanthobacter soli DSM 19599]|uniref:Acetylglutamate kinase n=1 Tax=Pseudoxanthobacter soli DSM 19599 TaxID=1123029 RepID=A0A1M7ZCT4_9HYPH|nr:acetylglutamate kinase [Pseudoxanthobacter soli]SHO62715.1 N-acetylglutamate kinase [Pseudoxanthobacter soli DSM 19599]